MSLGKMYFLLSCGCQVPRKFLVHWMILRLTLSLRRFKAREKIKLKIKLLTLTEVKRFSERFIGTNSSKCRPSTRCKVARKSSERRRNACSVLNQWMETKPLSKTKSKVSLVSKWITSSLPGKVYVSVPSDMSWHYLCILVTS